MPKYVPLVNDDRTAIYMLKAVTATPVDADWDNQDGAVFPNPWAGLILSIWAVEDGSDISIACQQENGWITYHVFDPGTDTWTTRDEGTKSTIGSPLTALGCSLALRSDGDVIIAYKSDSDTNEVRLTRREGSTWTDIQFDFAQEGALTVVGPDSSDRITCNYKDTSASRTITRSFSSANAFGSTLVVDSTADGNDYAIGAGIITSNEIYVPYIDSDGTVSIANWTSAANPTGDFTLTPASGTTDVDVSTDGPLKLGLTLDGTTRHLLFIKDTDDDIWHSEDEVLDGSAEITGAGAILSLSANKLTTDIGIIYDDNGTVKFALFTLAAPVIPEIVTPLPQRLVRHTGRFRC